MIPADDSRLVSSEKGNRVREIFHRREWQSTVRMEFRRFGTIREKLLNGDAGTASRWPKEFAESVTRNLEASMVSRNLGICILEPEVVLQFGSSRVSIRYSVTDPDSGEIRKILTSIDPLNASAFGLIREDGMISPMAFSAWAMFIHLGKGTMLFPYDTNTDFVQRLALLTPDSFM